MRLSILSVLLLLSGSVLFAQSSMYDHPDFKQWSKDFLEGNHSKVISDVEVNLTSNQVHPLASYVWMVTQISIDNLDNALNSSPNSFKKEVSDLAKLYQYDNDDRPKKIVEQFSFEGMKAIGSGYSPYLWARITMNIDDQKSYSANLLGLEKTGDAFRYIWNISNDLDNNQYLYDQVQSDLGQGKFDKYPACKIFLERYFKFRPVGEYDRLAAVRDFMKINPTDPVAMRFRAIQLSSVELYDSAYYWYEKALAGDPFYYPGGNLRSMAYCISKAGRNEELVDMGKWFAKVYNNGRDDSQEEFRIRAIYQAGDKGKAFDLVEDALKIFPESAPIHFLAGDIENGSSRNEQAVSYYKKAVELSPNELSYRRALIYRLISVGRYDQALQELNKIESLVGELNVSEINMKASIFEAAEELNEANLVYLEGIRLYPESQWIKRNLAASYDALGKTDLAIRTIKESIDHDPNSIWSYRRLAEILAKKNSNNSANTKDEFNRLAEKYPWNEEVWRSLAKLAKDDSEKMAVWELAVSKNPNRMMPFDYENMESLMTKGEKLNQYIARLKEIEPDILSKGSLNDALNLYFRLGYAAIDKLGERSLSKEGALEGIEYFQKYIDLGGRPGGAYQNMASIQSALGNKELAAELARKSFVYRPDTEPRSLITQYEGAKGFGLEYDWMLRDPYNRAKSFADLSVKYGGSPISALTVLRKYDVDDNYLINFCYNQLGNSARMYEDYYANSTSLGHERYIGWYNSTRHDAWKGRTQLAIEYESNTATIQFEDGTIAIRQDDLRLGKIRKVQVGDVWIKADYNDEGDLTKLETSAGQNVSLSYNSASRIDKMLTSGGEELTFVYNEIGKPVIIAAKGIGRIEVEYNSYGEILETRALNDNGEEGGASLATRVTEAMQSLQSLANLIREGHVVSSGNFPRLNIPQPKYESLSASSYASWDELESNDNVKTRINWLSRNLALASYLIDNTHVDAEYGTEAANLLTDIYYWFKENEVVNVKHQSYAIQTVSLFYQLMLKIRRNGVAIDYWNDWSEMQQWLQIQKLSQTKLTKYREDIEKLQEKTQKQPIELLSTSEWLPKSFLQNDGYWKSFKLSELIPSAHREGAKINCMLYRSNGDLVVGTSKGISVMRKGYWEWFGYNALRNEWQSELSSNRLQASSNVLSLTETTEGVLVLGTSDGILFIDGEYLGKHTKRITDADGLPSTIVTHLISTIFDGILIGTSKGAVWYRNDRIEPVGSISTGLEILDLEYFSNKNDLSEAYLKNIIQSDRVGLIERIVISTQSGISDFYLGYVNAPKSILPESRQAVHIDRYNELYFLKGLELTKMARNGDRQIELPINGNIITSPSKGVYGIANVPINENETAVAVLTDLGLSFYHENHIEHFYLPGKEKVKGLVNGTGDSFAGWSDESVWMFTKGNVKIYEGEVRDLLTINELGLTLMVDGGPLKYIKSEGPLVSASDQMTDDEYGDYVLEDDLVSIGYYGNATALALDQNNRVIANDGLYIKRYSWDDTNEEFLSEDLFYATQYEPETGEKYQEGDVRNIVVARDGTIWVATKMSVFRYLEVPGNDPIIQEFNYFRDRGRFPAPTHMIYRIFETNDGRIRVVASNESHLRYEGASLRGGYLEWDSKNEKFIELNTQDLAYNWVVHSYTPVSNNEAIVGTTNGFARDRMGNIQHFKHALKSPSYTSLMDVHPNLFLGTKGAKLDDVWLFGCGAGVVAYHDGRWIYPERLNQLLPRDLELKNYGSRHVNAISVDANGRIYVGTDLGLMIYDGKGTDAASFLLENDVPDRAFEYQSVKAVEAERDALLGTVSVGSDASNLLAQIDKNQKEMNRLEQLTANASPERSQMMVSTKVKMDSLNALITNKQKEHVQLLLQLESADPAIHQLLSIKPVEIASLRKRFKPDQCVVQYIPTKQRLYIQVLSQTQVLLREVKISQDSLMRMCQGVSNLLKHEVQGEVLIDKLAGLYDMLLRPISDEIKEYEHVRVIPVMSMYYVPFSALINRKSSSEFTYAVEEHHFGYVSSTNLLSLIMENPAREQNGVLLMGDADGSLPAAREEVKEINKLVTNGTILIGGDVTLTNLLKNAGNASIIHLATHGFLNEKIPSKSNILLAQDKRLSLPEAFNLPLDQTDMVVLSACETGKGGGSGLEYATMARAFTNAGASTVLATLWKVNDKATKELMVKFYGHLAEGDDKFTALAKAQRELLASGDSDLIHPNRWASFVVMGEP